MRLTPGFLPKAFGTGMIEKNAEITKKYMKNFPKILILLFLIIFVLQIICLFFLLIAPVASHAASAVFKPQVGIGEDFEKGKSYIPEGSTAMIGKYIRAIYKYAIGIIGILAAVVLMIGGILWIMAGGNATQITEAKAWIGASLTGLVLALSSYLLLATVNPALVNLKITVVPNVKNITTKETGSGCCNFKVKTYGNIISERNGTCKDNIPMNQCDKFISIFSLSRKCEETRGCEQYCEKIGEGADCGISGTGVKSAVCFNNKCVSCQTHENHLCKSKPCCAGLYCSQMPNSNESFCKKCFSKDSLCEPNIINICCPGLKCDQNTRRCVEREHGGATVSW